MNTRCKSDCNFVCVLLFKKQIVTVLLYNPFCNQNIKVFVLFIAVAIALVAS